MKTYFDNDRNLEICDVSGQKTVDQIKQEFGDGDFQVIEYDEKIHTPHLVDGVLVLKSNEDIRNKKQQANKATSDAAAARLASKFTEQDIKDIKAILQ